MYSRNRIGVVVPVREKSPLIKDMIASIPLYIDQIYLTGNGDSDICSYFNPLDGDQRISIVITKNQPDGDLVLTPAFQKALDDQMDVVAVMSGPELVNSKCLPSLLDPIVWGRADLTKVRCQVASASSSQKLEKNVPKMMQVSETKISMNYRDLIEALQKNIAVSRQVLEVVRETPAHESMKKILLAIPCFNEMLTIGSVILRGQHYVNEILVVDDGSTDDTVAIAQRAGAKVLSHPKNMGYGAALASCFKYANQNDFDALIILDGDGQHDPGNIPQFIHALDQENVDIVIGSRFIGRWSDIPLYRRFGMRLLDKFTTFASSTEISDSQSGFRAYGRKAIENIRFYNNDMPAGSEILAQVKEHDLKVHQISIQVRYDVPSASTQNPIRHGLSVFGNLINLIGYERPMLTFGITGAAATLLGLVLGFQAFSEYYLTSKLPYGPSFLSGIFLILGLLLITSGLILNTLVQILKRQKIIVAK